MRRRSGGPWLARRRVRQRRNGTTVEEVSVAPALTFSPTRGSTDASGLSTPAQGRKRTNARSTTSAVPIDRADGVLVADRVGEADAFGGCPRNSARAARGCYGAPDRISADAVRVKVRRAVAPKSGRQPRPDGSVGSSCGPAALVRDKEAGPRACSCPRTGSASPPSGFEARRLKEMACRRSWLPRPSRMSRAG